MKKKERTMTESIVRIIMFVIISGALLSLSTLMWAIIHYLIK